MTRGRGNARRGHPVAKPGTSRRPSCPRSPAPRYLHCRAPGEGEGSGRRRALAWSTLSPTGESRPEGGVSGECLPWGSSALCGSPRRASPPTADIASGRIVSRVRCGHRGQGTPHPCEPPWAEQNSAEGGDVGPGVVSSSVMAGNDGPGRAVRVGRARRVGDVHGSDHPPNPGMMTGIRRGGPRAARSSVTKCDSQRQATNTS